MLTMPVIDPTRAATFSASTYNLGKTMWLAFSIVEILLGLVFGFAGGFLIYNGFLAIKNKELILHPPLTLKGNYVVLIGILLVLFGSFALLMFYAFVSSCCFLFGLFF